MKSIEKCQEVAKQMINYANTDFLSQFAHDSQSIWSGKLVPLNTMTIDYRVSDFGMKLAPTFTTQDLIAARKQIDDLYSRNSYYTTMLANVLKTYEYPGSEITKLQQDFEKNTMILSEGVELYSFPLNGLDKYQEILSRIDKDLEKRYLEVHKIMEKSVHYKFIVVDKMCLRNDYHWTRAYALSSVIAPTGSKTVTAVHIAPFADFNIEGLSTGDNGNFVYRITIPNNTVTFTVNTKLVGNQYQGTVVCNNLTHKIVQSYSITGNIEYNRYFFPVFGS